jgi:hypothetical protein
VSDLMSERFGIPSTKYGPSVCCGVPSTSINEGVRVHVLLVEVAICSGESCSKGAGNGCEAESVVLVLACANADSSRIYELIPKGTNADIKIPIARIVPLDIVSSRLLFYLKQMMTAISVVIIKSW